MDIRELQIQRELDNDSRAFAEKFREVQEDLRKGSLELPRHNIILARACGRVRESLEAVLNSHAAKAGVSGQRLRWLRSLDLDLAAVVAIRECLRQTLVTVPGTKSGVVIQRLGKAIGRLWELEVRVLEAEKVNPLYMQRVHAQLKRNHSASPRHIRAVYNKAYSQVMKGQLDSSLSDIDALQLGKHGVQACLDAGLIVQERTATRDGTFVIFQAAPDVQTFLTEYSDDAIWRMVDSNLPYMVCPPEPYTTLEDGGYLTPRRKVPCLARTRTLRNGLLETYRKEFTAENMPTVFKVLNYWQSIPYTVHGPTAAAIRALWAEGGGVLGVPKTKPPARPVCPVPAEWDRESGTEEEVAAFFSWKFAMRNYYDECRRWRGKVQELTGFMRAITEEHTRIWFPAFFDSRGRWYYRGSPNPQGSDLAKAVLHFADKRPLGARGVYWLKVHIANCAGFDKARNNARAAWTEERWEIIERALDAPGDHPGIWGTDAPWCMFSAAWELREAYRSGNPETYETGLIVHQDASCSGLQHFSALLRDPVGAKYTNLVDSGGAVKEDIYTRVAALAGATLVEYVQAGTNPKEARAGAVWADVVRSKGISRSVAKTPVMTYLYNATLVGVAEDVRNTAQAEYPEIPQEVLLDSQFGILAARHLMEGVAKAVPAAAAMLQWLKTAVQNAPKDKPLAWTTPCGFQVYHDYQDYREKRVDIRSCNMTKVVMREYIDTTRPQPMQNAISPNFVHSLDACHITLAAERMYEEGLSLVGIHDSAGTHPSDVDTLRKVLGESFVSMYGDPEGILADFLMSIGSSGVLPTLGNLNLDDVKYSEFFFS